MKYIYIVIVLFFIILFTILYHNGLNGERLRYICGGGIIINDTESNYNESRVLYNITE